MSKKNPVDEVAVARLAKAFPKIDPGFTPFGSRVLVQIRLSKKKTTGGIILVQDTIDTENHNTQTARIVALGPLAFHSRNTMEPWPEGLWCKPGEFVRCPKYGGDRFQVSVGNEDGDVVEFVTFSDLDIIGRVDGDPLAVKAFL